MPDRFSYYGGIDFSGAREPLGNLWTAVGEERDGRLCVLSLRPHAFRADLRGYVANGWRQTVGTEAATRVLWGAGFALGVPAEAARHLCSLAPRGEVGWRALLAWVADRPADEVRRAVPEGLRTARQGEPGGAVAPFDSRAYKQTVEGLRWLHELLEVGEVSVVPQAPTEAPTTLVEVNPTHTVYELGLPRRRAPGRPGETRARAAALRTFLSFADPHQEAVAVTLEDAWDATIACLTAWLARDDLDQPARVADLPPHVTGLEGWAYRPPAAIE